MERRPELDGLRGVAIAAVVAAHAAGGVLPHYRGVVDRVSHGGFAGVQLFFVLSGYLITQVLQRRRGSLRFYRRRWQRLFPTLVLVTLVVVAWSGDWTGGVRAVTYTENIPAVEGWMWRAFHVPSGAMEHAWSLAVEEQFYLVWPVLLYATGRHAAKVAAVGIVVTVVLQQVVGWTDNAVYTGLRWDAVLAGCLLALCPWRAPSWAFAFGCLGLGWYVLGFDPVLHRYDYPVMTVAGVLMVASAPGVLAARWLVHLGHLSYALYLWHVAVMRLDLPVTVTLPASLVLAEVTYMAVDRRAQRLPGSAHGAAEDAHAGSVVRA